MNILPYDMFVLAGGLFFATWACLTMRPRFGGYIPVVTEGNFIFWMWHIGNTLTKYV